jgi:predicted dehydrogenase
VGAEKAAVRAAVLVSSTAPHRIQPPLGYYLPALLAARGVAGIAVSDTSAESAGIVERSGAAARAVRVYPDHRRMLAETAPEFAIVSSPPLHAPALIRLALEAGCHVMADKPAALGLAEFDGLVALAARRGRHLMLPFANRLAPLALEARRLVRSGALGRLYAGDVVTVSDQARLHAAGYAESWHARKATAGGGHLIWLGGHYVDLLQYLSGERIRSVAGFVRNVGGAGIEVEDAAAFTMELERGALCTFHTGYYLPEGNRGSIALWGSEGWLRLTLIPEPALEWHSSGAPGVERRADTSDFLTRQYGPFIQAALDAARGAGEPPITAEEGRSVLAVIFAAYRAAETDRAQRVS